MHYQQWILLVVILVFGAGVIGSYVQGISANPGGAEKLWGGVTGALRTFNYIAMLLAVAGFFLPAHVPTALRRRKGDTRSGRSDGMSPCRHLLRPRGWPSFPPGSTGKASCRRNSSRG